MKTYKYLEYYEDDSEPVTEITEDEIIEKYWSFWWNKIKQVAENPNSNAHKLVKEKLREACIEDFVVSSWAWEKK